MKQDLIDRLRGKCTNPVNDGAGLLDGKDTVTQECPVTPINREAADAIEELMSLARELWSASKYKAAYSKAAEHLMLDAYPWLRGGDQ